MPKWGWFVAWFAVGCAFALGVLGALTIGIFVLPIAGLAMVFVATRRNSVDGLPGLVSGLSLPLFSVAFLNRDGPGNVCSVTATSTSCTEEWSPWPWLLVGLVLMVLGIVLFIRMQHRRKERSAALSAPGAG